MCPGGGAGWTGGIFCRTSAQLFRMHSLIRNNNAILILRNSRSMCFFFGGICSSVVALQTNLAKRSPARLCLAAVTRSTRLWPATFGLCRSLFIFIANNLNSDRAKCLLCRPEVFFGRNSRRWQNKLITHIDRYILQTRPHSPLP